MNLLTNIFALLITLTPTPMGTDAEFIGVQIGEAVTIHAEMAQAIGPVLHKQDIGEAITAYPPCPHEDSVLEVACMWWSEIGFNYISHPTGSVEYVSHYFPPCPFVSPLTGYDAPELTDEWETACEYDGFIWTPWSGQGEREIAEIIAQDFHTPTPHDAAWDELNEAEQQEWLNNN